MSRARAYQVVALDGAAVYKGLIRRDPIEKQEIVTLPEIDISTSTDGVVALPADVPEIFREHFAKYTNVTAPNGKPADFAAFSIRVSAA